VARRSHEILGQPVSEGCYFSVLFYSNLGSGPSEVLDSSVEDIGSTTTLSRTLF